MVKLHGKLATVQISDLWAHGGPSLVLNVWRDDSDFFNYTATHQRGKNPLWLTYFFILLSCEFPKGLIITL